MRLETSGRCYTFEHASGRVRGHARAGLGGARRPHGCGPRPGLAAAAADVLRLGARYREAAADLAYARRRFGDDPVTRRLETLVLRARPLVYGAPAAPRIAAPPISRTATGERWQSGPSR